MRVRGFLDDKLQYRAIVGRFKQSAMWQRVVIYACLAFFVFTASIFLYQKHHSLARKQQQINIATQAQTSVHINVQLTAIKQQLGKLKQLGLDTTGLEAEVVGAKQAHSQGDDQPARKLISSVDTRIARLITAFQAQKTEEAKAVALDAPKKPSTSKKTTAPATITPAPAGCAKNNTPSEVLCRINTYRQENKLAVLSFDNTLAGVAAKHSAWMNSTGNFSHTGENGSKFYERCAAAGITCFAEIIALSSSAESAFTGWRNSPGHNATMLGKYTTIGIGIAGRYYSADFR